MHGWITNSLSSSGIWLASQSTVLIVCLAKLQWENSVMLHIPSFPAFSCHFQKPQFTLPVLFSLLVWHWEEAEFQTALTITDFNLSSKSRMVSSLSKDQDEIFQFSFCGFVFPREFFAHDAPLFRKEKWGYFLCVVVLGLLPVTPSWTSKINFYLLALSSAGEFLFPVCFSS